MSKVWYALCTKPKKEKKVASILEKKGIETFLPYNLIVKKSRTSQLPLFPEMLFINTEEQHVQEIRQINGVVDFLYLMDKPATIKKEEIDAIKDFTLYHKNINVISCVSCNNKLSTSLSSKNIAAVVMKGKTDEINLPSLGYSLQSEVKEITNKEISTGVRFIMPFQIHPSPLNQ